MKKRIFALIIVACFIFPFFCGYSGLAEDEITDKILAQFEEFTEISRPSHHEEAISDYLVRWAQDRSLKVIQDEAYNVIIDVPATENMEDKPLVSLQTHMDMVFACKDGADLDPLTTKITAKTDGRYLTSDGNTSLGADDGIGMAVALMIAEGQMPHGPIRLIVTTCEENGMVGVKALNPEMLDNVSYIINIDGEEEGSVVVSSAEGDMNTFDHVFQSSEPSAASALKISLSGLAGGHSGLDIHKGKGNAIRILSEALKELSDNGIEYALASFQGGTAENAIPTRADVIITVSNKKETVETVKTFLESKKEEFKQTDPDMTCEISEVDQPTKVISVKDSKNLVSFALAIPDGVYSWVAGLDIFPESSANLGIFELDGCEFHAVSFARSSSVSKMEELNDRFRKAADDYGISNVNVTKSAEAWAYDPDSQLLQLTKDAYKKCFHKEINVSPVHAGAECGAFAVLKPGVDIIALGPTITDPHTVNECCDTATIFPVWQLIQEILNTVS